MSLKQDLYLEGALIIMVFFHQPPKSKLLDSAHVSSNVDIGSSLY